MSPIGDKTSAHPDHGVDATIEQVRLLMSLAVQRGETQDATHLASLSKWEASNEISRLRGQPVLSETEMDTQLEAVLSERVRLATAVPVEDDADGDDESAEDADADPVLPEPVAVEQQQPTPA